MPRERSDEITPSFPPTPQEPLRASQRALTARDFWRGMESGHGDTSKGILQRGKAVDIRRPRDILALWEDEITEGERAFASVMQRSLSE